MSSLTVQLSHAGNPDCCGYHSEPIDSGKKHLVEVADYAQASRVCRAYIDRNELGGGNWTGGAIRLGRKTVARVSYNGRVWAADGTEIQF